jgi:hypothetical protein
MKVEHWWNNDWKGKTVVLEKIVFIINSIWTDAVLNPGHRSKKPILIVEMEYSDAI